MYRKFFDWLSDAPNFFLQKFFLPSKKFFPRVWEREKMCDLRRDIEQIGLEILNIEERIMDFQKRFDLLKDNLSQQPRKKIKIEESPSIVPTERVTFFPFQVHIVSDSYELFQYVQDEVLSLTTFSVTLLYSSTLPMDSFKVKFCFFADEKKSLEEDGLVFLSRFFKVEGFLMMCDFEHLYYISLRKSSDELLRYEDRLELVRSVMENTNAKKVIFNAKPQLKLFSDIEIKGIFFGKTTEKKVEGKILDPKIYAWVINPDVYKEQDIEQLASDFCNIKPMQYLLQTFFDISCWRVYLALHCMETMCNTIIEHRDIEVSRLLHHIELPLIPILAQMERRGFGFVKTKSQQDRKLIEDKISFLESQAHDLAGCEFSLASPSEVAYVLYEKLKLPFTGRSNDNRQHCSTSAAHLLKMTHPLADVVLQHRKLDYLLTHYVNILSKYAFYDQETKMDRVHPVIMQTTVPTGRLSFTDPNLQAITHQVMFTPVDYTVPVTVSIRDSFVATEGFVLLSADYCQIEIRLMAHFSQDPILLRIFSQDVDVFQLIASEWLNKPPCDITKDEREKSKHIVYGILYGMGPFSLAERMQVDQDEAEQFISSFKSKFKGLTNFIDDVVSSCKKMGYVQTICGKLSYFETYIKRTQKVSPGYQLENTQRQEKG